MSNECVALHIITEADSGARLTKLMPAFKPAGNIKDEAKKLADVAEKERAFLENARLSPVTGKICGFGWKTKEASGADFASADDKELSILQKLFMFYKDFYVLGYDATADYDFFHARASLYPSLYSIADGRIPTLTSLTDMCDAIGLVPYTPHADMYFQRKSLGLKEMAAYYDVPYSMAIHYDKAINDWRIVEANRDKTSTFDHPDGEDRTPAHNQIHDIIVKALLDKANTIYELHKGLGKHDL